MTIIRGVTTDQICFIEAINILYTYKQITLGRNIVIQNHPNGDSCSQY